MHASSTSRRKEIIAGLAVLLVVVAIVTATTVNAKKKPTTLAILATSTKPTTSTTTNTPVNISTPPVSANTSGYTDGEYTATGSYDTPGGHETIKVNMALKDGNVTATSAKATVDNHESEEYADQFISSYKDLVVGKAISSLNLSRVAGSSLTTLGFNNALAQIKQDAQS